MGFKKRNIFLSNPTAQNIWTWNYILIKLLLHVYLLKNHPNSSDYVMAQGPFQSQINSQNQDWIFYSIPGMKHYLALDSFQEI